MKLLNYIVLDRKNHFAQCCPKSIQNGRLGVLITVKNEQKKVVFLKAHSTEAAAAPHHFVDDMKIFKICAFKQLIFMYWILAA
ncbi:hypothetical protein [Pseudovibrio axinellae]|uniref:hypothetical protein n=1 Tax=Pseudovibrio axinellae TaxID=989403 RepID=UPI000941EA0F|nr:hypothetical protein [Pseudovibrio axinellae]